MILLFVKKILTAFLTLPGIIILMLGVLLFFLIRKGEKKLSVYLAVIMTVLYLFSTQLVSNCLTALIEQPGRQIEAYSGCDVIVVLGGGLIEDVIDLSGTEIPSAESQARILSAVRLYRNYPRPIIVTGGIASGKVPEALIMKKFLVELGVRDGDVIVESESRDTSDNAFLVNRIMMEKKYRKAALVTSSFHMRRASMLFRKNGVQFVPCPSLQNTRRPVFSLLSVLPEASPLRKSALAIKEILGILFYKITG
ncbi:MAG: YdcF family protein [Spirochaetes bacterium]|nr:YdcF family protein [Spirochaetota bacterium]